MALNYIFIAFFLIAFVVALIKLIFFGDTEIFPALMKSTFDNAELGFQLSLGLTSVLTLWMGLMKVGEKGGVVAFLARLISPLFSKIFPEVPKNHPAYGPMVMNFSMNFLGLDNAATPMGLQAMERLQELNPKKDTATNAQIMFLVLNTSGLTLIPLSIMTYRAIAGAANPTDIFLPILLATYFSTLAGLITVAIYQKINLFNKTILIYLGGLTLFIALALTYFTSIPKEELELLSSLISSIILFGIIAVFVGMAFKRRINVYDAFIEGAKEGFNVAIKIIPYLVGILVAIGVFRTSGTMDIVVGGIREVVALFGANTDFVDALPTALMKPLSGGGARGMMVEAMDTFGADSFVGRLSSIMQGSTETTFYVLAVYFGSVKISKTRYAVTAGLIADFVGILAAIFIAYLFFH